MNTIIDIPALHEYLWRKSTDGIVTISQDGLARILDVNCNRLHEKITQACGQGRITKLSWSTKGTVFQVTDPDTFIPKSKKRLDKNVVHQWLWDNSSTGQLIISKATITEKFNLNVEYIRQEFLPRLELEKRIVRKGFNNQGIILEITDPSTWKLPIEAKRKPPDFRFNPKRWACKDCKKSSITINLDLFHFVVMNASRDGRFYVVVNTTKEILLAPIATNAYMSAPDTAIPNSSLSFTTPSRPVPPPRHLQEPLWLCLGAWCGFVVQCCLGSLGNADR